MSAGQLLKQANQLKRAGRLDEAIDLYHQVIEINPNFAWAYYYLAETSVKQDFQHNWDSIIAHLQKAIFLNPQSSTFHRGLERIVLNSTASWLSTTQVTQVYCGLGNALMELGEFAAASRIFAQLIEKYPSKLEGYDGAGKVAIRLIENLETYQDLSHQLKHHIRPQHSFIGNNLERFDRVFQVENLGELGKKLSEIVGYEVTLPRLNTGGRKIPLKELSEESMEKLIDYYAKDYELLHEYYSPEKIWQEYQLSLSQE